MASHMYFYKILDEAPPTIEGTFPLSPLDKQDGFIHLSTNTQLPIVADMFFSQFTTLWLLQLRVADLDGNIQYTEVGGPGSPHLHDSKSGIHPGVINSIIQIEKGTATHWRDVQQISQLED